MKITLIIFGLIGLTIFGGLNAKRKYSSPVQVDSFVLWSPPERKTRNC